MHILSFLLGLKVTLLLGLIQQTTNIFSYFFSENSPQHFMQIVSLISNKSRGW